MCPFCILKIVAPLIQRELQICVAVTWFFFLDLSLFYSVWEMQKELFCLEDRAEVFSSWVPNHLLQKCRALSLFLSLPLWILMFSFWWIQYVDTISFNRRLLLGVVSSRPNLCLLWAFTDLENKACLDFSKFWNLWLADFIVSGTVDDVCW